MHIIISGGDDDFANNADDFPRILENHQPSHRWILPKFWNNEDDLPTIPYVTIFQVLKRWVTLDLGP